MQWQRLLFGILTSLTIGLTPPSFASTLSTQSNLILDPNLTQPSPFEDWKTLETDHFHLHYQPQHLAFTQRMALIAEKVHTEISPFLEWQPKDKTHIVINDSVDNANGGATPLPYNRFYIYMNTPVDGDLLDHTDWTELVFTHEYTHILQHDQVSGAPETVRDIFGRTNGLLTLFSFPEMFGTHWLSEGLAVYDESANGFGRGNSAIFEAKMRQEVIKGLESFTAESYEGYYNSRWPFGQVYLYGTFFFQFVEERYGKAKLIEYVTTYNKNLIPWRMDSRAYRVFGLKAEQLWQAYQRYLTQRFKLQISRIRQQGIINGESLPSQPYRNQSITAGPDESLYYVHQDEINHPAIRQIHTNGDDQLIRKLKGVQFLDWHPQQGLLIGKSEICKNTQVYTDLYQLQDDQLTRLTECARIARATWSQDGQIFGVQLNGGHSRLVSLSPKHPSPKKLLQLNLDETIGQIDISPDNQRLVANVKRKTTGWNLEELDLNALQWTQLTLSQAKERRPQYAENGKDVYYLADNQDQVELHRLNLDKNQIERLTNSLGYMVEFDQKMPKKGSKMTRLGVFLVEYTGKKEQLRYLANPKTIETKPNQAQPINAKSLYTAQTDFQPSQIPPGEDYQALDSLAPVGWFPMFGIGTNLSFFGAQVTGRDILGFHRWNLSPIYFSGTELNLLGGGAAYNFYNRFTLSATKLPTQKYINNALAGHETKTTYQAKINHPFNHLDWAADISLAAAQQHQKQTAYSGYQASWDTRENTLVGSTFLFNNLNRYGHSISVTDGWQVELTAETYDLIGNSDYSGNAVIAKVAPYWNIGHNQTIKIGLLGATGGQNIEPFQLGNDLDALSSIGGTTQLGQRDFALRGYKATNQLAGQHATRLNLEYRFPLGMIYDGFQPFPLGIGKIWGQVFSDTGAAWNDGGSADYVTGLGAEVSAEILFGYDSLILPITLGYAKGLDSDLGDTQLYLQFNLAL